MEERHYLISEMAKLLDTESHVLRYWEEELQLDIPRNELGHRYYTDLHIWLFGRIKELKEKGYQLKAIKEVLPEEMEAFENQHGLKTIKGEAKEGGIEPQIASVEAVAGEETAVKRQEFTPAQKMEQFQTIMTHIVSQALRSNNEALSQELSGKVGDRVIKEMNYVVRMKEEKEEERFKKLDETIRSFQRSQKIRAEVAATRTPVVPMKKKKRGLFRRKKNNFIKP